MSMTSISRQKIANWQISFCYDFLVAFLETLVSSFIRSRLVCLFFSCARITRENPPHCHLLCSFLNIQREEWIRLNMFLRKVSVLLIRIYMVYFYKIATKVFINDFSLAVKKGSSRGRFLKNFYFIVMWWTRS